MAPALPISIDSIARHQALTDSESRGLSRREAPAGTNSDRIPGFSGAERDVLPFFPSNPVSQSRLVGQIRAKPGQLARVAARIADDARDAHAVVEESVRVTVDPQRRGSHL